MSPACPARRFTGRPVRRADAQGASLSSWPDAAVPRIEGRLGTAPSDFSRKRNAGCGHIAHVVRGKTERLRGEDASTVVTGFIGACPSATLSARRVEAAAAAIGRLACEADFGRPPDCLAIRRTNPSFGAASGAMRDPHAR